MRLKRARLADNLNEKIAQRPGPMELVEKNILPVDSSVKEAIIGEWAGLGADNKTSGGERSRDMKERQVWTLRWSSVVWSVLHSRPGQLPQSAGGRQRGRHVPRDAGQPGVPELRPLARRDQAPRDPHPGTTSTTPATAAAATATATGTPGPAGRRIRGSFAVG